MEVVKHKVDRDLFVVIYYASAPVLVLSYLYAMQRRRLVGRFDEESLAYHQQACARPRQMAQEGSHRSLVAELLSGIVYWLRGLSQQLLSI
jgi:hypothetical protein